jgi:hypothetical protein
MSFTDESIRSYDVIGSISGKIQSFGTGLDIDAAQALKTKLEAEGIGGVRDTDTGYNSGIQNAQSVDNVTVVRSSDRGEALLSTVGEQLTVTASVTAANGAFFTPTNTISELVSLTVNGSGTPDVTSELLLDGKIRVIKPTLATTDTVSAIYLSELTDDVQTQSETLTSDGSTQIFELLKNYIKGSVAITTAPSAIAAGSKAYVTEGGGNLLESGYVDAAGDTAALPAVSGDVIISYQYSSGEQAAVPSAKSTRDISRVAVTPGISQIPPIE